MNAAVKAVKAEARAINAPPKASTIGVNDSKISFTSFAFSGALKTIAKSLANSPSFAARLIKAPSKLFGASFPK